MRYKNPDVVAREDYCVPLSRLVVYELSDPVVEPP